MFQISQLQQNCNRGANLLILIHKRMLLDRGCRLVNVRLEASSKDGVAADQIPFCG
jgi:hypothetical protein